MKVPEPDEEQPLAWIAILADTPVYSTSGQEVGTVHEVLGAEDIFHGVVVHTGLLGHDVMIPATDVTRITNRRVDVALDTDSFRALPPYREEESYKLGFVGLLRRHLGWVADTDEGGPE